MNPYLYDGIRGVMICDKIPFDGENENVPPPPTDKR